MMKNSISIHGDIKLARRARATDPHVPSLHGDGGVGKRAAELDQEVA